MCRVPSRAGVALDEMMAVPLMAVPLMAVPLGGQPDRAVDRAATSWMLSARPQCSWYSVGPGTPSTAEGSNATLMVDVVAVQLMAVMRGADGVTTPATNRPPFDSGLVATTRTEVGSMSPEAAPAARRRRAAPFWVALRARHAASMPARAAPLGSVSIGRPPPKPHLNTRLETTLDSLMAETSAVTVNTRLPI